MKKFFSFLFSFLVGVILIWVSWDNGNVVLIGLGIFFIILSFILIFTPEISSIKVYDNQFQIDDEIYNIDDIIELDYNFKQIREYFNIYYKIELNIILKNKKIKKKLDSKPDIKEGIRLIKKVNKQFELPFSRFYLKEYIIIILFISVLLFVFGNYLKIEWINFVFIIMEFIFLFGFIREIDRYISYKIFLSKLRD